MSRNPCKTCRHSALCLPVGVERYFGMLFHAASLRCNTKTTFSKFELMTMKARPRSIVLEPIEKAYKLAASKLSPWCVPKIRLEARQEADIVELQISFSNKRRLGYQGLRDLPLQFDLKRLGL